MLEFLVVMALKTAGWQYWWRARAATTVAPGKPAAAAGGANGGRKTVGPGSVAGGSAKARDMCWVDMPAQWVTPWLDPPSI